jgi:hypothetical protein
MFTAFMCSYLHDKIALIGSCVEIFGDTVGKLTLLVMIDTWSAADRHQIQINLTICIEYESVVPNSVMVSG